MPDEDQICLPTEDLKTLLESAAEKGANKVLRHIGLDDDDAVQDIKDLRDLLSAMRLVKTTALTTIIKIIITIAFASLCLGIGFNFK